MQENLSEIESSRKITFRLVETLAERLKLVRKVRGGITQQQMADAIGVKRGAVGNWERGETVSRENLSKISDVYGVSLDWLQKARGEPPGADAGGPSSSTEISLIEQNALPAPPIELGPSVPLLGQGAAGPDGRFAFHGASDVIAHILAPPKLARVRGAYALYVRGTSMEERYFNGEIVFVDPHRPCHKGHFVVAQIAGEEGDPPGGYIKRFVSYDARQLKLEQLNPRKILTFPRQKVAAVHRIIMGGEE
jgi:phage repressor protein C with HTH and peptisase S24 domain